MTACWAIVPSAGEGLRAGAGVPKQYMQIAGFCVVEHSIHALLACDSIEKIIVAVSPSDQHWETLEIATHPKIETCQGGKSRFESVTNALKMLDEIADDAHFVTVHDAARPCLLTQDLEKMLKALETEPAGGIAVMPVADTMKTVQGGYIGKTLPREELARAVTPQIFRYEILCTAMDYAKANDIVPSDEAVAVEHLGHPIKAIECDATNIKLTYPSDVVLIQAILAERENANRSDTQKDSQ